MPQQRQGVSNFLLFSIKKDARKTKQNHGRKCFLSLNNKVGDLRSKELFYSVSWGKIIRPFGSKAWEKIVVLLLKDEFPRGMLKYI